MSEKKANFTHDNKNNKSVDWYTPAWVFNSLGTTFDLDPCSPKGGLPWLPAKRHLSLEDDGLAQPWEGKVWLNPPYGKFTEAWLAKMHQHRNGIALVFARTDNAWFHKYVTQADAILFTQGRINFVDGKGVTSEGGPGAGSVFVAWGEDNVRTLSLSLKFAVISFILASLKWRG